MIDRRAQVTTLFEEAIGAEALIDLVEQVPGATLVVERAPTYVDYRHDGAGAATPVTRVTSGEAGRTILSGDLWSALRRWAADDQPAARYVFRSDGALYPSAVSAVADRLARFGARAETPEDLAVVAAAGIDPGTTVLRRVELDTGRSGADVLAGVYRRVNLLLDAGSPPDGPDPDDVVRLLLARAAAIGAERAATISRAEVIAVLGLDPRAIRLATGGS